MSLLFIILASLASIKTMGIPQTSNYQLKEKQFRIALNYPTLTLFLSIYSYNIRQYGGRQNLYDFCVHEHVLKYLQKQGWLDTNLDHHWECNSFQFYAGDLFDLINNLYLKVNPRQLLEGKCTASANNLNIRSSRDIALNVWEVRITYNCSASSKDKNRQSIQVLNFNADV